MSGFLFKHPCGMFANYQCEQCGKPICGQHSVIRDMQNICLSCQNRDESEPVDYSWRSSHYWSDMNVDWDPNSHESPIWYRRKKRLRQQRDETHSFVDADETLFEGNRGASGTWEDDLGAS